MKSQTAQLWSKIIWENFEKNSDLWENFRFLRKFWIFEKIFDFWENFRFLRKFWIFEKKFNFLRIFSMLRKIPIFEKRFDFWEKIVFLILQNTGPVLPVRANLEPWGMGFEKRIFCQKSKNFSILEIFRFLRKFSILDKKSTFLGVIKIRKWFYRRVWELNVRYGNMVK